MVRPKRARKNLLDELSLDAPYVTETRRLLQNLYRLQRSAPSEIRSYMVTSAGGGEGKSTICSLMAILSARIFHKRTLLIDGDLHRPSAHALVGVVRGPGLYEILRRGAAVAEVTRATSLPLLWVIPSGYPREEVGGAYSDEDFSRLLREVRSTYDVIFVDAPPAVPALEPVLMGDHVDGILIVAMAGRTPLAMVRRSVQVLEPLKKKIVGIILNNAVDGLPYAFNYRYYGFEPVRPTPIRRSPTSQRPEQANAPKRVSDNRGGT